MVFLLKKEPETRLHFQGNINGQLRKQHFQNQGDSNDEDDLFGVGFETLLDWSL